jgi:hypothetical protein
MPKAKCPSFSLQRVRINSQGYDSSGQYYGRGAPLYRAESKLTGHVIELRAGDRKTAKEKLCQALAHVGLGLDKDFNVHDLEAFKGTDYAHSPAGLAERESELAHIDRMNAAHEKYARENPEIVAENIRHEIARRKKVVDELIRKGFKEKAIRRMYPGYMS